jgi:hypothetical protein
MKKALDRTDIEGFDKAGIYRIKFNTGNGWKTYQGISGNMRERLIAHRACAERLGFSVDRHEVYIARLPQLNMQQLRDLEKRMNGFLITRHPDKITNKNREINSFTPAFDSGSTTTPENLMHTMTCRCSKCRSTSPEIFEVLQFGMPPQTEAGFGARDSESSTTEGQETELAMELLSVSSEAELDQFLGKLVSGALKGVRKIGRSMGKFAASPLGGVLKGVAKTALPFVGGALGSLIPVPGVGTVVGTALGSAVSAALEAELGELDGEQMELESARRFVRIARSAARAAALAPDSANPHDVAHAAVTRAARQYLPNLDLTRSAPPVQQGRWVRQGMQIVLHGA